MFIKHIVQLIPPPRFTVRDRRPKQNVNDQGHPLLSKPGRTRSRQPPSPHRLRDQVPAFHWPTSPRRRGRAASVPAAAPAAPPAAARGRGGRQRPPARSPRSPSPPRRSQKRPRPPHPAMAPACRYLRYRWPRPLTSRRSCQRAASRLARAGSVAPRRPGAKAASARGPLAGGGRRGCAAGAAPPVPSPRGEETLGARKAMEKRSKMPKLAAAAPEGGTRHKGLLDKDSVSRRLGGRSRWWSLSWRRRLCGKGNGGEGGGNGHNGGAARLIAWPSRGEGGGLALRRRPRPEAAAAARDCGPSADEGEREGGREGAWVLRKDGTAPGRTWGLGVW